MLKRGVVSNPGPWLWLFPVFSFCFAIVLGGGSRAYYQPDADFYRALGLGQLSTVASPFSGRVLGPFLAAWLGRVTGVGLNQGFLLAGLASLAIVLACAAKLLRLQEAQAALFAAIFLMPFWADLFAHYYLPDLLHAAILAALLLALATGQTTLAMLLLFPAYVARESTLLVALCLVVAAWRRLPLRDLVVGSMATVGGALVNRHFVRMGAPNAQGLSGGPYMAGKFVWSFARNILGVSPWTNTVPYCKPFWTMALPAGTHMGGIHLVGMCGASIWGPSRSLLAWFGIFGVGPAIALALFRPFTSAAALSGASWLYGAPSVSERGPIAPDRVFKDRVLKGRVLKDRVLRGRVVAYRFSILYGGVSLLLAPLLGASTDRLVQYAWPIFFVALAWFVAAHREILERWGALILFFHLAAAWAAWYAFRAYRSTPVIVAGVIVFALNVIVYLLLRRRNREAGKRSAGEVVAGSISGGA
jgi:hypothetical protein